MTEDVNWKVNKGKMDSLSSVRHVAMLTASDEKWFSHSAHVILPPCSQFISISEDSA